MSFGNPAFLYALPAVLLPLIIHLLKLYRSTTIYYTRVSEIKQLKRDQKKVKQLKDLLTLIIRTLAILFLVFAFAQASFTPKNTALNKSNAELSLFIDNSASNQLYDGKGLEEFKNEAIKLLDNLPEEQLLNLITLNNYFKDLNLSEAIKKVNDIELSLLTTAPVLEADSNGKTFIFSDFQKSTWPQTSFINNSQAYKAFKTESNIAIDTVYALAVKDVRGDQKILSQISRTTNAAKKCTYKLSLNGEVLVSKILDFGNDNTLNDTIFIPADSLKYSQISIDIEDANGLIFDNSYKLIVPPLQKSKVLIYTAKNDAKAFEKLLSNDKEYQAEVLVQGRDNFVSTPYDNLLIVAGINQLDVNLKAELQRLEEKGGVCLFFPGKDAETSLLDYFKSKNIVLNFQNSNDNQLLAFRFKHPFFKDVFSRIPNKPELPYVNNAYAISGHAAYEELISGVYGALAIEKNNQDFSLILSGIPYAEAGNSNFFQHALFVPFALKALEKYNPQKGNIRLIGTRLYSEIYRNGEAEIFYNKQSLAILPWKKQFGKSYLDLDGINLSAGFYTIKSEDFNAEFAINYTRSESNINFYSNSELENFGITSIASDDLLSKANLSDQKSNASYLFFALVFILLLLESIVNKLIGNGRKTL